MFFVEFHEIDTTVCGGGACMYGEKHYVYTMMWDKKLSMDIKKAGHNISHTNFIQP